MAGSIAIFWKAVSLLLGYSLNNDDASHILLIPLLTTWLVFIDRERIFRSPGYDFAVSIPLSILGIVFITWGSPARLASPSACALGLVLLFIAGFALAFGREAVKNARFPLLFTFLFVPLPQPVLARVVYLLQKGSAEITALLFSLTPLPVLREGFVFHLPRFSIAIASECSGIRSSIALLVLAILTGHFFLKSFWKQAVFILAGMLVMIVKNGIRIVALTLLANYVDPGFLHGNLHRDGGFVFFAIGLLLLVPMLWLLQRGEAQVPASAIHLPQKAV
jgi:exosortase